MALLGMTAVTVGCGGSAVVEAEAGPADDEAELAEAAYHDSVFPLPDGAVSPLLPYETFNDGIVSSESSSFQFPCIPRSHAAKRRQACK